MLCPVIRKNIDFLGWHAARPVEPVKIRKSGLAGSNIKMDKNIQAIEFVISALGDKARLNMESAISTESNLGSTVFENIATAIGIDPQPYEAKYKLVDESLLKRRNHIAHGEYIDLDPQDCRTLGDEVISLLRAFKTDIENAAALGCFRRTAK